VTKITIELPDEVAERLEAKALRLNVSREEITIRSVEELLKRPDAEFERLAQKVVADNLELLKRLA
jgi:predicted transcriptional regulator